MEKETIEDEEGRIMNSQHYFKKLGKFDVCAFQAEKGCIEVEEKSESCGIYHYVFYGSAKIGKVFESGFETIKKGDFFSMKDYLYSPRMYEALEDFYMFGFNIQNKDEDWDGRLLKDEEIKVENESVIICLDGNPFINNKRLIQFDYADLSSNKIYDVELNEGVVALFTKV